MSRRARRRVAIGLFLLIVTVGVVIAVIAFQRFGTGDVKGELGGYRLIDDQTVAVTITVTRDDPSVPAVCIVRIDAVVKSTKPPVVGDIYGCGIDVPGYLTAR
jgi:hypothetical protein